MPMMRLTRHSDGQTIIINDTKALGAGGEAHIFAVASLPELAAKIYRKPTDAQARKLRVMLAAPPEDPAASGSLSIAWPCDLLREGDRVVGFLMPRIADRFPIFDFYHPATRRQQFPLSNAAYLHRTARNLAAAFRALHAKGYVIGDVNESNILVTQTALVALVDTDSFQVRDSQTGEVFRCPVGKLEFTPPELQGRTFLEIDRQPEQDLFGLGVLIFQLLMEGTHPFAGVYQAGGDPPPYESRIQAGHFPYGSQPVPYRPMPSAPPFAMLNPTLQRLFLRCFEQGHRDPKARPTAQAWRDALTEAEAALISCAVNPQHRYDAHNAACPWCDRTRRLGGRDPFPSPTAVRQGQHLRPRRSSQPSGVTVQQSAVSRPTPNTQHLTPNTLPPFSGPPPGASTPVFAFPRNVWAIAAVSLAVAAVLPGLHLAGGLAAVLCGALAWVWAAKGSVGGRGLATFGAGLGMTLVFLSFLLRPERDVLQPAGKGVMTLAFGPFRRTLAVGTRRTESGSSQGAAVTLWNTETGAEEASEGGRHQGDVVALDVSPKGDTLAVGSWGMGEPGDVELRDMTGNRSLWRRTAHENSIQSVAFSPDGARVATGGAREWVRTRQIFAEVKIWDAANGSLLQTLTGAGEVFRVAFSPDGKWIAAGCGSSGNGASGRTSEPGRVQVWNAATGQPLWTQNAHATGALCVAFSPDGHTLASSGYDNAVRLWDALTGRVLRTLESDSLRLNAVAFSPDGQMLATGGSDFRVTLWNPVTGAQIRQFVGHTAEIRTLAFSRDGKLLASGSLDGTVRIWRMGQ